MVGDLAAAEHDVGVLLPLVARRVSEVFGTWCVIGLLGKDGRQLEIGDAIQHPDPLVLAADKALVSELHRVGEGLVGQVLRTGQPALRPVVDGEELPVTSLVVAPLVACGPRSAAGGP